MKLEKTDYGWNVYFATVLWGQTLRLSFRSRRRGEAIEEAQQREKILRRSPATLDDGNTHIPTIKNRWRETMEFHQRSFPRLDFHIWPDLAQTILSSAHIRSTSRIKIEAKTKGKERYVSRIEGHERGGRPCLIALQLFS